MTPSATHAQEWYDGVADVIKYAETGLGPRFILGVITYKHRGLLFTYENLT